MVVVTNQTQQTIVADRCDVATAPLKRLVGLLARRTFTPSEGLIFPHCNSIHTCFMRFPIDVVFLKQGVVIKTVADLGPFRWRRVSGADTVIELPAGAAAKAAIQHGHALEWTPASAS